MRKESISLLIVFILSFIPQQSVPAEASPSITIADSLALMYLSDALLLPEDELDISFSPGALFSRIHLLDGDSEDDQILASMIHAKKQERNDLDAAYRQLSGELRSEGAAAEANQVEQIWKEMREEINSEIGLLHQIRGDQRKPLTRLWHSIKRSGRGFWHRIGPVGRNFLRRVGPEALQVVTSGGSLTGGVIKNIFKHTVKKMAQERMEELVYKGVSRMAENQADLAQETGDLIEPDQEQPGTENGTSEGESQDQIQLPGSGVWNLTCTDTIVPESWEQREITWKLDVNWGTRTWTSSIRAVIVDTRQKDWYFDWNADAQGQISDQGYFTGSAAELQQVYSSGRAMDSYPRQIKWIGVISSDMERICLFRGGDQEYMSPEWIEAYGRDVFIAAEGGYCEALCLTGSNQ